MINQMEYQFLLGILRMIIPMWSSPNPPVARMGRFKETLVIEMINLMARIIGITPMSQTRVIVRYNFVLPAVGRGHQNEDLRTQLILTVMKNLVWNSLNGTLESGSCWNKLVKRKTVDTDGGEADLNPGADPAVGLKVDPRSLGLVGHRVSKGIIYLWLNLHRTLPYMSLH